MAVGHHRGHQARRRVHRLVPAATRCRSGPTW